MFQEILLEIEKESFTSLFKRGRDRQGGEIENWRGQGWDSLWQIGEENVNLFNFVFDYLDFFLRHKSRPSSGLFLEWILEKFQELSKSKED